MTLPEAVVASLLAIYPQVCAELGEHFPPPVAQEIAKYALVRRAFEDGWTRPPNISVPGLGTGKAVREKIELARKNRELQVYTVVGEEERRFIAIYGPDAHIISTVVVGLTLGENPKKANLGYGPGGEMLNRAVEEIWGKEGSITTAVKAVGLTRRGVSTNGSTDEAWSPEEIEAARKRAGELQHLFEEEGNESERQK